MYCILLRFFFYVCIFLPKNWWNSRNFYNFLASICLKLVDIRTQIAGTLSFWEGSNKFKFSN